MSRRVAALRNTAAFLLLSPLLSGCENPDNAQKSAPQGRQPMATAKGPHGGELVELESANGLNLFAELVKDYQADRVRVHILNRALVAHPIDAPDVTLVITGDFPGSGAFLLRPPNASDGKSAHFELVSEAMEPQIEADGVVVELHTTNNGQKYVGRLKSSDTK